MKKIAALSNIPRNEEFKITERATKLMNLVRVVVLLSPSYEPSVLTTTNLVHSGMRKSRLPNKPPNPSRTEMLQSRTDMPMSFLPLPVLPPSQNPRRAKSSLCKWIQRSLHLHLWSMARLRLRRRLRLKLLLSRLLECVCVWVGFVGNRHRVEHGSRGKKKDSGFLFSSFFRWS